MRKATKTMASLVAAASLGAGWTTHAQAAPPPYGGEPTTAPRPGPIVVLRTDNPHATLQVQTQLFWQDVCITPCAIPVDPARLYRVGGRPFVPSDSFTLPRPSGQVTIEARMGSRTRHLVGEILTLAGLGVTATGGVMFYTGRQQADDPYGGPSFGKFVLTVYGVAFLIAGTAITLTGIPLWASSGTSMQIE